MRNVFKTFLAVIASLAIGTALAAQAQPAAKPQPAQAAPATAPAAAPQQAPQSPARDPGPPVDGTLLAFGLGMTAGYDLGANNPVIGRTFGFDLMVADGFAVGLASTSAGAVDYRLFHLGYGITPGLGCDVYVGNDGSTAAGLGLYVNLQRAKSAEGVFSTLKLRLQYLADSGAGFASGNVILAVATTIGI